MTLAQSDGRQESDPAPIVDLTMPDSVLAALQDLGYRAGPGRSDQGDPTIESAVSGVDFEIRFFGCNGVVACDGVLFTVGFDLDRGLPLASIDRWNGDALLGRAYTDDECDPLFDHYQPAQGRMDLGDFEFLLSEWDAAVADFRGFIRSEAEDLDRSGGAVECESGSGPI